MNMNKIWSFIKPILLLAIFFFGFEYLLYDLLSVQNKLYYMFFVVFIFLLAISIAELNKKKVFSTILNSAIVLSAVLVGLCLLGIVIKFVL